MITIKTAISKESMLVSYDSKQTVAL